MANFFARVELHGAKWPDDYEELHDALAKHGFTNCMTFDDKSKKSLPTGFYFSTDRVEDVQRVTTAVKKCADDTGYKNEVVVVKSGGSSSYLSKKC
ncbi:MAG TPA: hypothetical protein VHB45_10225 [Alloacidobacterium sp.]|nr:hypothetical protein [Alloacidobacterium sp.]